MRKAKYDHYSRIGKPAEKQVARKKRPNAVAVVDEDNCSGCQVCVPFCPTGCIVPGDASKFGLPIPPVHVVHEHCIGCRLCYHACAQLAWDAIRMVAVDAFEAQSGVRL